MRLEETSLESTRFKCMALGLRATKMGSDLGKSSDKMIRPIQLAFALFVVFAGLLVYLGFYEGHSCPDLPIEKIGPNPASDALVFLLLWSLVMRTACEFWHQVARLIGVSRMLIGTGNWVFIVVFVDIVS